MASPLEESAQKELVLEDSHSAVVVECFPQVVEFDGSEQKIATGREWSGANIGARIETDALLHRPEGLQQRTQGQ